MAGKQHRHIPCLTMASHNQRLLLGNVGEFSDPGNSDVEVALGRYSCALINLRHKILRVNLSPQIALLLFLTTSSHLFKNWFLTLKPLVTCAPKWYMVLR